MNHTTGPWRRVVKDDGTVVIVDATGNDICTMGGNTNDGSNGRVVAAAPELLAALQYLSSLHPRRCILAEVVRARAAVAKATP